MAKMSLLFKTKLLSGYMDSNRAKLRDEILHMDGAQFRSSSEEQLLEHFYAKYELQPIMLHRDMMTSEQEERDFDIEEFDVVIGPYYGRSCLMSGLSVKIKLPFTGSTNLLGLQPSTFTYNPPLGNVRYEHGNQGTIIFEYAIPTNAEPQKLGQEIQRNIDNIESYLAYTNKDVAEYNASLPPFIRELIEIRRSRLEKHENISRMLNIPLEPKPGTLPLKPIPIQKRIVPALPKPATPTIEPGITDQVYEQLLMAIRFGCGTYETTPKTFQKMGEESLRDILLAHLNSQFQAQAKGEAFRNNGKTDILIEYDNQAAFVAECKNWGGEKVLHATIDQLLGYLVWRDCKTAIVLYNRDVAGFKSIQDGIEASLRAHPNFIRLIPNIAHGEWRMVVASLSDPARHITIHIFLANLYCDTAKPVPKRRSKCAERV